MPAEINLDMKRPRREGVDLNPEQVDFIRRVYEHGDQQGEWNRWFAANRKALSRIMGDNHLVSFEYRETAALEMVLKWYDVALKDFSGFDIRGVREVAAMLAQHLTCLLLRPAQGEDASLRSRMGGQPEGLDRWPSCPACTLPMNFVLQLFRDEFPQMYFPPGREGFLLFRCPDGGCCDDPDRYDRTMLWIYTRGQQDPIRPTRPETSPPLNSERQLGEFHFHPIEQTDYPSFVEEREAWWGELFSRFSEMWSGSPVYDKLYTLAPNQPGTKIGGFPSWQQEPGAPVCPCGREKSFFFQLASFCPELTGDEERLAIGDSGNIYFFHCAACGENSIETAWDCG